MQATEWSVILQCGGLWARMVQPERCFRSSAQVQCPGQIPPSLCGVLVSRPPYSATNPSLVSALFNCAHTLFASRLATHLALKTSQRSCLLQQRAQVMLNMAIWHAVWIFCLWDSHNDNGWWYLVPGTPSWCASATPMAWALTHGYCVTFKQGESQLLLDIHLQSFDHCLPQETTFTWSIYWRQPTSRSKTDIIP